MIFRFLKNRISQRKFLMTGILTAMVVATCLTLIAATQKEIKISDNGNVFVVKTAKNTVAEVFEDENITLEPNDILNVDLSSKPDKDVCVDITRAKAYTLKNGSCAPYEIKSAYDNVYDILNQNNIIYDDDDKITMDNGFITLTHVDTLQKAQNEVIGFETVYENDDTMYEGTSKTVTEGSNGICSVLYNELYENGAFISKSEVSREVVKASVNKVIKKGTKKKVYKASPLTSSYSNVITCRATAYDGSYATLKKSTPKTAIGTVPSYGTVAVDPKVIPLGTKLYIASVDGSYIYGYCTAADTGGAIKGNRVDLFMNSRSDALNFGSRQVNVFILG